MIGVSGSHRSLQMIKQILGLGGISIGISLMVCSGAQTAAARQTQQPQQPQPPAASNAGYEQPKTPWGEPDLQGIWPLNHLISTPCQRQAKACGARCMTSR